MYNLFSDPHLGVRRQAHTTSNSSARLTEALYKAAMAAKSEEMTNIIAGDLFDKTFNSESVVIQGIQVAKGNTVTLAGNHDETNREGTQCSLEVVHAAGCDVVRIAKVGIKGFSVIGEGLYLVPHHHTQELFLEALKEAAEHAMDSGLKHKYLFVHCNRGDEIGENADSTLFISRSLETTLLEVFSRIFYGHEHGSHSNKVNGDMVESKAVVLGNTHPTSFSDISNKYRYVFNSIQNTVQRIKIWDKDTRYLSIGLGSPLTQNPEIEFVEVTGNGSRSETVEFIEQCWEAFPNAYAIRPRVIFDEEVVRQAEATEPVNLLAAIEKDLEGTSMLNLFHEIKGTL